MKLLQAANAVLLALTATFAVTLGVVWLMYAVHLDTSPRMRAEWGAVSTVTGVFWVMATGAALAFWGQRRGARWRWVAQTVSLALIVLGALVLVRVLQ